MTINTIPLINLSLIFLPVLVVIAIFAKWQLEVRSSYYALTRMLLQLLLVGYFLTFIFESKSASVIILILAIMVFTSSWIALRSVPMKRTQLYKSTLIAILISGGSVLLIVSQGVLRLKPWYLPQYLIPLAGMIFANSMNSVSLAAERFFSEYKTSHDYIDARSKAIQTSMLPITNSLFAVGLVSLPGMMTGQILTGVSPFIAARYQIMVMCMIFASAGISSALFLVLIKRKDIEISSLD